jgi:hypothetical protein
MFIDILGMSDGGFIILTIVIAIILFAVWYNIIRSASKSYAIVQLQKMQVKLLKEIALKNGVDEKKVDEITHDVYNF